MSKWIAEFELEDGDSMPEHMDLNFMGARLDFHCKPVSDCIPIPEDATNGDVIKAMFPKATISKIKSKTEQTKIAVEWHFENIPSYYNLFYEDWWNAPYKAESEK